MLRFLLTAAIVSVPGVVSAQTVDDVLDSHRGGCTTAGVEALSEQIVRSHLCAFPGAVAEFSHPNIHLTSSRVHPLGASETVSALHRAADSIALEVNSGFRTLVEQYLLFHEGGCGLAAEPGDSNHQTGRAVDLANYSAARSAMVAAGCVQSHPDNDPVHYDCPGPDMRAASTLVFQRLWNRNHPEDLITEDGDYGPQTASRVARSPAGGFADDLCVETPTYGAEFVSQSFPLAAQDPIVLHPGATLDGYIELRNVGTATWNESTLLGTSEPRDRASAFALDWISPSRASGVIGEVAPGATYAFDFSIRAPDAPGEYREHFGLVQEGVTWFADQLGPPDAQLEIKILVVHDVENDAGSSDRDAGMDPHEPLTVGCGCRTSRSGDAPWMLLGLALVVYRRRRATIT
jgi:MYXO-CTERM domain-containing protein